MKRCFLALPLVLSSSFCTAAESNSNLDLQTEQDKVSYSLGINIGGNMRQQAFELNVDAFSQGFSDGFLESESKMTEEEIVSTLVAFQQKFMEEQMTQAKKLADENLGASTEFLEKNAKLEDITTTESGLQYRVLSKGEGPVPNITDTVKTHYRGTLIDGSEFDSSYVRNEPAIFPVDGVIAGWTEALQMMHVGSKWQLFIPPELAYGEHGAGNRIGPNQALVFEIELLDIEKPSNS